MQLQRSRKLLKHVQYSLVHKFPMLTHFDNLLPKWGSAFQSVKDKALVICTQSLVDHTPSLFVTPGLLHGSCKEDKEFWKNLEGLLLNKGFLEYKAHLGSGFSQSGDLRSYSALAITPAGG